MSLLKQNQSFSVRDFLFIAVGLLGIFGFFMTYDSQDPRSIIRTDLDQSSAMSEAEDLANSLGFNTNNYRTQSNFATNGRLLDSLQTKLGRPNAIAVFQKDSSANLFPYFWEVHFEQKIPDDEDDGIVFGGDREDVETGPDEFIVRYAPSGEWIEFINSSDLVSEQAINRSALRSVFASDSVRQLLETLPDSVWHAELGFSLNPDYNDTSGMGSGAPQKTDPWQFDRSQVLQLSDYYLQQSGWAPNKFDVSDIRLESIESTAAARIRYSSIQPIYGQEVVLQASVKPTGTLLNLSVSYNPGGENNGATPSIWGLTTIAALFFFGIGSVVIFYFRIRARVIDTKSALVVGILAGFIVPVIIFLDRINETSPFESGASWVDFIGIALSMGITGAVASVGFFVISSVGDSITRQHWPEKLDCYDYLRQGMFFNKPVGEALVRSVVLTFVLAGFWSFLLLFFPDAHFEVNEPILNYETIWPPVYLVLDNIWYSLIVVFSIFLVVGSQTFAQTSSRWFAGALMILAVAITGPIPFLTGAAVEQFFLLMILGAVLTTIYLYWDFVTLLFTHFFFSCLLVVASGWIIEGSPDFYVFVIYLLLLLVVTVGGVLFIVRGKEKQALPDFVPEYVEELAQEERIKQELQIARDVQQSFLPASTPAFNNLDLAAVCKPAHETGGDYYDFIQLDDHRLGVAIGDVSGKGIQAAFYMTFTKGILRTLCRETESPAEVLKKANRLFYENARRGTFISLIYGIVDIRQNTFRFARAGHNPVLHFSAVTGSLNLIQPGGLGLGLTISDSFDSNIEEITLDLAPGDLLALYTDGIIESLNAARQFYGTNRLQKLLKKSVTEEASEILSDLVSDVTTFAGQTRQHDDMTVMVIKLNNES